MRISFDKAIYLEERVNKLTRTKKTESNERR